MRRYERAVKSSQREIFIEVITAREKSRFELNDLFFFNSI